MAIARDRIAAIRFGYGPKPGEAAPRDAADLMAELRAGVAAHAPRADAARRIDLFRSFNALRASNRDGSRQDELRAVIGSINETFFEDVRRSVLQPVLSPHGFFERLAWFWTNHFSVAGRTVIAKSLVFRIEEEAIRPNLAGPFRLLLRAAATHPAMLDYLDQSRSVGPASAAARGRSGLNENLAREIIELHTLGVGAGYTQADVRQFAELLTGLTLDPETGFAAFDPRRAEPGAEQVLGKLYGGAGPHVSDIHAALDDLAARPETARRLALKLATHFVSDTPPPALVAAMEAAYLRSDGDLPTVYEAMLDNDESWSRFGEKVKQPFDFIASSLRVVGMTEADAGLLDARGPNRPNVLRTLRRMNQVPHLPPGPQGWPEEAEAWITPQGLAARIDWASRLARTIEARWDPRDLLTSALPAGVREETAFVVTNAAERWEGIALALASPDFNRR